MSETNPEVAAEPPADWCCQDSEEAGFGDEGEEANAETADPEAEQGS